MQWREHGLAGSQRRSDCVPVVYRQGRGTVPDAQAGVAVAIQQQDVDVTVSQLQGAEAVTQVLRLFRSRRTHPLRHFIKNVRTVREDPGVPEPLGPPLPRHDRLQFADRGEFGPDELLGPLQLHSIVGGSAGSQADQNHCGQARTQGLVPGPRDVGGEQASDHRDIPLAAMARQCAGGGR